MAFLGAGRAVLLSLVALLLPVHLLSSRLLHCGRRRRLSPTRSLLLLVFLPVLLSAIFNVPDRRASSSGAVVSEVDDLKLVVARLESILLENTQTLDSKILHLDDNNKLIEGMEHKIQDLQNTLCNIKGSLLGSPYSEERFDSMEEEVQLLWAESRKNNFDIQSLEHIAQEAEEKVEEVSSEVEKLGSIVTEQWIQIQQLEQALQMTKRTSYKVHKRSPKVQTQRKPITYTMLQFIKSINSRNFVEEVGQPDSFFLGYPISNSLISQVSYNLRKFISAIRRLHHELQESFKEIIETTELAPFLVNDEIIFFLASATITFPIMISIFCLSSYFGQSE